MTLNELLEAAQNLQSYYVADQTGDGWFSGADDNGHATWNHWSGALDELKTKIGRRLTDVELCVFSLSLDYGPTPGIESLRRARMSGILFPQRGGSLSPLEVIRRLAWSEGVYELEEKVNNLLNPPSPTPVRQSNRSKFRATEEVK